MGFDDFLMNALGRLAYMIVGFIVLVFGWAIGASTDSNFGFLISLGIMLFGVIMIAYGMRKSK